jgi:SNF family Na+-dependent transporter
LTSCAANEFCEVILGGLITIPAAYIFLGAQPVKEVAGSTLGLGFFTIPSVFEYMPAGHLFGFLWFFLLFLAAITSSISMLQPAIAFIEEGFNLGRKVSVAALGLVTAAGCLMVVYFSKDLKALDMLDFWVGNVLIFVMGTIMVIFFGWVFGAERGLKEANRGAHIRIPNVFKFVVRYITPLYLTAILAMFIRYQSSSYVKGIKGGSSATLTVLMLLLLFCSLTLMVHLAGLRWDRQEGRGKEGRKS